MRDTDPRPVTCHAREYRVARGWPKYLAAAHAGITERTLTAIEKGQTDVRYTAIMRLAYSHGVSPADLYPGMTLTPGTEIRSDGQTEASKRRVQRQPFNRAAAQGE